MINGLLLPQFRVCFRASLVSSRTVTGGGNAVLGWKSVSNWLAVKLKRIIRKEIQREAQQNLLTHNAARQALDLYEMRLETLDTRLAKRIMALEARITELEGRGKVEHLGMHRDVPDTARRTG